MEVKSIRISKEVYEELVSAKGAAVKYAKDSGNDELAQSFASMGVGAFAGWLIFKAVKDMGGVNV